MKLRAPNGWLFVLASILVIIAILQYLAIPLVIPEIASLSIPRLSIADIPGLTSLNAFWLLFLGWALLALATVRWSRFFGRRSGQEAVAA